MKVLKDTIKNWVCLSRLIKTHQMGCHYFVVPQLRDYEVIRGETRLRRVRAVMHFGTEVCCRARMTCKDDYMFALTGH
jgi:hypothetical protein